MAPFLVPLIAGGMDLLAKAVTKKGKEWLQEKTGVELADNANLSDGDMLKLKQFEMEHEEELLNIALENKRLDVSLEKAYLADTGSARDMQMTALNQDDLFSKRFLYYFAIGWSIIATVFIFGITFWPVPETSVRFADTILGFLLGTIVAQIIAFFFGSSRSSKEKDDVVAALTKGVSK